ncbi:MAG: hypothetical protein HOD87_11185, partial [Gammaproteobacteria bacterium]|nr:hypothetical protein [Gammaproteobacteria bacterium]
MNNHRHNIPMTLISLLSGFAVLAFSTVALAQLEPINVRPNPFSSVDGWVNLPAAREWGSTAGVDIDPDGRHLWAID